MHIHSFITAIIIISCSIISIISIIIIIIIVVIILKHVITYQSRVSSQHGISWRFPYMFWSGAVC